MTKCIKRIRDLFEYALCKFTLLTYLLTWLWYEWNFNSIIFSQFGCKGLGGHTLGSAPNFLFCFAVLCGTSVT